jgi:PTH1 family peptidyl-tRNA hydrolase
MVPVQLVVGLGNPGTQYARTRHNAGFWVIDEWVRMRQGELKSNARFMGLTGRLRVGAQEVWVLKPTTFMNKSGQAVQALCQFYQIAPESVLVIHDELDLPNGQVRLKFAGGHGGHNGLRDLTRVLGPSYWRLRMGIDHPGSKDQVLPYVLGAPFAEQIAPLQEAVSKAVGLIEEGISIGFSLVMNSANRRAD